MKEEEGCRVHDPGFLMRDLANLDGQLVITDDVHLLDFVCLNPKIRIAHGCERQKDRRKGFTHDKEENKQQTKTYTWRGSRRDNRGESSGLLLRQPRAGKRQSVDKTCSHCKEEKVR